MEDPPAVSAGMRPILPSHSAVAIHAFALAPRTLRIRLVMAMPAPEGDHRRDVSRDDLDSL